MAVSSELLAQIDTAVTDGDPYRFADSLQAVLNNCRAWAAAGNWAAFRPLADTLDDLLADQAPQAAGDTHLSTLMTLARQVCVVLALMGDTNGERDSGYFRASMAHARRLDAMTEDKLQLVALVDMVSG